MCDPSIDPESEKYIYIFIYKYISNNWAWQVAQTEKNLPTMWETWARSLGWEDPLEKGMATHSSIRLERSKEMTIIGMCDPSVRF